MSQNNLTPTKGKVGMRREKGGIRRGYYSGTLENPQQIPDGKVLQMDLQNADLDVPYTQRDVEENSTIGDGRNEPARIIELGFPVVEQDIEQQLQTGILLYYVLGGYNIDGKAYGLDEHAQSTGGLLDVNGIHLAGDTTVLLNGTITDNIHVGREVIFSGHAQAYLITANASNIITIAPSLQSDLADTEDLTIKSFPDTLDDNPVISTKADTLSGDHSATATITLTTGGLVASWYAGGLATINGVDYYITDNAAGTLTLNVAISALAGVAVTIKAAKVQLTNHTAMSAGEAAALAGMVLMRAKNATETSVKLANSVGYTILSATTAGALLLNSVPTDLSDLNLIKVVEAPFEHTISEAETLPTMILRTENRDHKSYDHLGTIISAVEIRIEKDAKVVVSSSVKIPRSLEGVVQETDFPSPLGDTVLKWDQINNASFLFQYNGNNIDGTTLKDFLKNSDAITIRIENDIEITKSLYDEYGLRIRYGLRRYLITVHYYPQAGNLTLANIRNLQFSDYAGDIVLVVRLQRTEIDYIHLAFSSLRLATYPDMLVVQASFEVGIDFELKNAPGGTLTCGVKDNRNTTYYTDN
jgi:hypothetical protein